MIGTRVPVSNISLVIKRSYFDVHGSDSSSGFIFGLTNTRDLTQIVSLIVDKGSKNTHHNDFTPNAFAQLNMFGVTFREQSP